MPLSEHEQKVLQQMEQALYAEDPRFASHITNHGLGRNRRRLILGVVGVVAGLALVVLSALNGLIWLGAVGFALMVAGGAFAFTPAKKAALGTVDADGTVRRASTGGRPARPTKRRGATFMQRLEERWDRRRDDNTW
ncbi:DUF3040 domain-containing protein [Lapillicoccus jejuensis]|uniref:DUF3040 family protein n=1 Tax=Lapillicoccus jejuensis TaxID=402171 RepID=A0A542E5J2_9MICO|nr:DUF3040 domain-containing protein [Lapillicoccus jejuensis]TQJ10612.1 DUF3040 family protein [Lapillicoccus jejuensis]